MGATCMGHLMSDRKSCGTQWVMEVASCSVVNMYRIQFPNI